MGNYTDQKYYLIDGSEFVNVGQDIAYNVRQADEKVKRLIEYEVTDVPSINQSSIEQSQGYKFYKRYSGAIYYCRDDDIFQDVNSYVDGWSNASITFETGYGSFNQNEGRVSYWHNIATNYDQVRLRGSVVLNGGASDFPLNVSTKFMTLPTALYPTTSKYFTVYGGNATGTDFQAFRIFIPSASTPDKRIEFCKYGAAGASSTERYISLNDINYHVNI